MFCHCGLAMTTGSLSPYRYQDLANRLPLTWSSHPVNSTLPAGAYSELCAVESSRTSLEQVIGGARWTNKRQPAISSLPIIGIG